MSQNAAKVELMHDTMSCDSSDNRQVLTKKLMAFAKCQIWDLHCTRM